MWYIVGFRKIISFKIGVKKYIYQAIWKNKVDYHLTLNDFLKKKVYVVLIVFLK
jgi:hypothetical protein